MEEKTGEQQLKEQLAASYQPIPSAAYAGRSTEDYVA